MNRGKLQVDLKFLHTIMRLPEDVEIESVSFEAHSLSAVFILTGDSMPDDKYDVKIVKATTHNAYAWTELKHV